jgi:cytochrome c peroxidase
MKRPSGRIHRTEWRTRGGPAWPAIRLAMGLTLLTSGVTGVSPARAADDTDWKREALSALLKMPHDRDAETRGQVTPPVIPSLSLSRDPLGWIGSLNQAGATITADSPFFQNLGSNGRTCFTCHQPQNGWGISAAGVQQTFKDTDGMAPIFRPVDGAVCPTAGVLTMQERRDAYSLLLSKGVIRIGLPVPAGAEFSITAVSDPYGCNTAPSTGLTAPNSGIVSVYRRPLPTTNLGFVNAIMWDGREPSLQSQAVDATIGHAQGETPLTPEQVSAIVAFETGLLTAQNQVKTVGDLGADGATGGPNGLQDALAAFFPGINDPLGGNPQGTAFSSAVFDLYDPWIGSADQNRAAIQRGQTVFNTKPIAITGVNGINDALGLPMLSGFCGTCHDSPNVGNHSVKLPINIGISNAGPFNAATGTGAAPILNIAGLPVFTVTCNAGVHQGTVYTVTDLGRGMISGACADIGKVKGPVLRGLASRAPYFHNGSAASLDDVVTFYDQRFGIQFTEEERSDLVAFLNAL